MDIKVTGGQKYEQILRDIVAVKVGVKAGILAGATNKAGQSIPMYALFNEFGTSRIPPRPFMRETAKTRQRYWINTIGQTVRGHTQNKSVWSRAVGLCGAVMEADIKQTIQKGDFAANAESTIAAKKAKGKGEPDHPLIDSGAMLAAVKYEVTE